MTVTRRLLALVALLVVAAVLATSCAAPTATPTAGPTAAPTKAPLFWKAAGTDYPVSLQTADSQYFTITAKPMKIVSLPVWSTEMLFEMVDVSRVVAISSWTDDPNTSMAADKAKQVAVRVKSSNAEEIIALKPDLVIVDDFNDYDGALTKTLRDAGIATLYVKSPTSVETAEDMIPLLAAVVGESAKGDALLKGMKDKIAGVAAKLATLDASKRLTAMYVYPSYNDPAQFTSYNSETPVSSIMTTAGLVNVCDAPKYSDVSKEKVVSEWKPQVFLVPSSAYLPDFSGTTDDGGAAAKAAILADATLKDVPAVVDGRIYGISDKYMTSTSQYMADAVVLLAQAAYPDLFK